MPFYLLVAILPMLTACATGVLMVHAWQRRDVNATRAFAVFLSSVFVWCFFSALEQISPGELLQVVFGKIAYIGIAPLPVLWLLFTLRYAQHDDWIRWPIVCGLSVVPLLSFVFAFTDRWFGLMWKSTAFQWEPYPKLLITHGWWYNCVFIPHYYALVILGYVVLVGASFAGSDLYRKQTLLLVAAGLCPLIFNMFYVISGIQLYGLDVTPLGFSIAAVLVYSSLFNTKFLDVAPISYKTVFLNTADAVILLDLQRRIVDFNPAALCESAVGYKKTAAVVGQRFGRVFPDYCSPLDQLSDQPVTASFVHERTETVRISSGVQGLPPAPLSDASQDIFREVKVCSLMTPGGRQMGWTIIVRDVTLEKQQQAQLEQLAFVDSLTGLFNRRQLELKAEEAFTARHPSAALDEASIALLYVDLNHFKPINDNYGHDVGDAVLHHFAKCLQSSVRKGDLVARLGGDEFAALLYDANPSVALEVRSRLTKMIEQETVVMGHRLALSASIGMAFYPTDGTALFTLLRHADQNMYKEKQRQR